jgi:ParB family transcriptional regulator, chromosome partitioning protein
MPLRIEPMGFPDLAGLESAGPRLLPLDSIDEDPDQPRSEFDAAAMEELASTIRLRGVLQPVSVRPHPVAEGRWMLNFGSRRYRASRLAERDVIPAFVDESFDTYAQVIENEQREALQPMELALFVKKRRALGETQAEIGRLLGKSQTYVSMAHALIDAPDWLMAMYRQGKCRGLTELYHLRRLHETAPQEVEDFCRLPGSVSRTDVQRLITARNTPNQKPPSRVHEVALPAVRGAQAGAATDGQPKSSRCSRSTPALLALYEGKTVDVVTDEAPWEPGRVFVIERATAARRSVVASLLLLQGFEKNVGG